MNKSYSFSESQLDNAKDSGNIKRDDLDLRTAYVGLKTKIFMIEPYHYVIQILNCLEMFELIRNDFNQNIRRMTDWVEVVENRPEKFVEEISPLDNVAQNFEGLFLNKEMIESLLVSRFPKVNILSVEVDRQNGLILTIFVGHDTEDQAIEYMKRFVMGLKIDLAEVKINREDESESKKDSLYLHIKDEFLACTDPQQEYSIRDSEYWFDHVEDIYTGKILIQDLDFFDSKKSKCYVDYSVINSSNLNIRSLVLLYDKIYMSFPMIENFKTFMDQQHLKIDDLEELVERDKLIIFLPYSEKRYNQDILNQLYHLNQNSVISRRGINALMAMYYYKQNREYMSFWEEQGDALQQINMELAKTDSKEAQCMRKYLLWPILAEKDSFQLLTNYGPLKLSNIGINYILDNLWNDTNTGKQLSFNLRVNSNPIYIASALQATYFPQKLDNYNGYSPEYMAYALLGDIISSYKYCFSEQRETINEYALMLKKDNLSLKLLDTDNSLSLNHILYYEKKYKTPKTLKTILDNLSNQNETERKNQIANYNNQIAEIGKEKFSFGNGGIQFILGGVGLSASIITPFLSDNGSMIDVINMATMTASALDLALATCSSLSVKDKIAIRKLSKNHNSVKDDVYILDKLCRVARIKGS